MDSKSDIVVSTAHNFDFLMILIIILSIFILYFLYYFIKKRAFQNLESFLLYAKVIGFTILLIILLICLIDQFIIIEITEGAEYATIIFVLINAFLIGVYINITFSSLFESKNKLLKYTLVLVLLYVTITNFGDLGIRLILNTDVYIPLILVEKVFESNTPQGVRFMFHNIVLLLTIFGTSFLLELKKR